MLQKPLMPTAYSAVIVTRPDQGVEQAGSLDFASSKGSDKPVVRKQGATLASFSLCYQKIFVPKKFRH